ncbi:MAG: ATP-binding protein [Ginsengibacter sp.]
MTIVELIQLKETENKVEFKEAKGGNYSFNGGGKIDPKDRRKCIIGYTVAFANEGGGYLVFGVHDKYPHQIVGTNQCLDAVGKLEQDIYREKQIRVQTLELYHEEKRVLVIKIPARPAGKVYKFEDVPLMRVGEELLPMSDEKYLKIIQEQEPDFSEKVCEQLTLSDLDAQAIQKMKEAYAEKQKNPLFLTQNNEQCLSDLHLLRTTKLTYAALVLLGKEEVIRRLLPQAAIFLEYRKDDGQITFDDRKPFYQPYFLAIEKLWEVINLRNGNVPVQQGPYIFDIPFFNNEVIREAVNNAVAHRDYRRSSEVVIKQYPQALHIISPGGFPIGVNLNNLLTVSSTPRNRLLAEVLAKTGIVERSGQGIDKIFYQSIAEAKGLPDYNHSDDFQVELRLSAIVKDKAFTLFIKKLQNDRQDDKKLSVKEILVLEAVREGKPKNELDKQLVDKLIIEGLLEKHGKTSNQKIILSKLYYAFTNKEVDYTKNTPLDENYAIMKINQYLAVWKKAKMGKFVELFKDQLTRDQVKTLIYKLSEPGTGYLEFTGVGSGREYFISKKAVSGGKLIQRAIEVGLKEMRKSGELNTEFTKKPQDFHKLQGEEEV